MIQSSLAPCDRSAGGAVGHLDQQQRARSRSGEPEPCDMCLRRQMCAHPYPCMILLKLAHMLWRSPLLWHSPEFFVWATDKDDWRDAWTAEGVSQLLGCELLSEYGARSTSTRQLSSSEGHAYRGSEVAGALPAEFTAPGFRRPRPPKDPGAEEDEPSSRHWQHPGRYHRGRSHA